MEELVP